ncbi:MAG: tetratricopeptide repeat protein [Terriglobales bacterium]
MHTSFDRLSKFFGIAFLAAIIPAVSVAQNSQTQPPAKATHEDPSRQHAEELYSQGKFVAAMPLFEALVTDHPSDVVVRERWAWCVFQYAATLPDPEQRKSVRARARKIAVEAKGLGDNTQLLQLMLEQPEDGGSDVTFSDSKEVDSAMKAAEADFSRGDLDKAREGYMRVLTMDPNNYDAALFTGDVFFKQHRYDSAGEWFSRAIKIDANRETAYRYWGDALVAMGKEDEARSKFIDGIVADPYSNRSWIGLQNWLKRNKVELNNVRLKDGAAVAQKDEKNISITIDDSSFKKKNDPNGLAWMTYSMGRASWQGDQFKKEFPNEPKYRRTLKEESESLGLMITVLKEQKDYEKQLKNLDPSLQSLIKIQEAGFLDPFVLLNRADAEIARDYQPYRAANREKIRRYLDEFVVPKTPARAK